MPLDPGSNPWRTLSSEIVYFNQWSTVREDRMEGPGERQGLYGFFDGPESVMVLPLFPDGTTMLVRQWRYVFDCSSWELVVGGLEVGEDPRLGGARELAEEAGLAAERWTALGHYQQSDARIRGRTHCFLAEGLTPVEARPDDSEVDLVRQRLPLAEAVQAVLDGRITHVGTGYVLLRAWAARTA
jgi:ADP-ribose pyrophosphatase